MTSNYSQEEYRILDSMISSIEESEIYTDPFTYCYLQQVFPDDIYSEILENLPDNSNFQELRHKDAVLESGYCTRKIMPIDKEVIEKSININKAFWHMIKKVLHSQDLKFAFFARLSHGLLRRHNIKDIDLLAGYPKTGIFKDSAGFQITPHTDTLIKLVTTQLYLPSNDLQKSLGTSIYKPIGHHPEPGNHNFKEFDHIKSFCFAPNCGHAFVVSNDSWHGREPIDEGFGERVSIFNIYSKEPNEKFYDLEK